MLQTIFRFPCMRETEPFFVKSFPFDPRERERKSNHVKAKPSKGRRANYQQTQQTQERKTFIWYNEIRTASDANYKKANPNTQIEHTDNTNDTHREGKRRYKRM